MRRKDHEVERRQEMINRNQNGSCNDPLDT